MKVYRNLTIAAPREVLVATISAIEQALTGGWSRNQQIEEEGRARAGLTLSQLRYCFKCTPTLQRKGALLVLMSNAEGNLWMSNIVPDEVGQLTPDEFNSILEEFLEKFARPAATKTRATIETSSDTATIDDWFSTETAAKLRRFVQLTRGSTSHLDDYKLWMAFLVAAHSEGAQVPEGLLQQWLVEGAGCDEYRAQKLTSQYRFSQDIMNYAAERVGA